MEFLATTVFGITKALGGIYSLLAIVFIFGLIPLVFLAVLDNNLIRGKLNIEGKRRGRVIISCITSIVLSVSCLAFPKLYFQDFSTDKSEFIQKLVNSERSNAENSILDYGILICTQNIHKNEGCSAGVVKALMAEVSLSELEAYRKVAKQKDSEYESQEIVPSGVKTLNKNFNIFADMALESKDKAKDIREKLNKVAPHLVAFYDNILFEKVISDSEKTANRLKSDCFGLSAAHCAELKAINLKNYSD